MLFFFLVQIVLQYLQTVAIYRRLLKEKRVVHRRREQGERNVEFQQQNCERRRENEETELVPHLTNYDVGSLIAVLHPSQETHNEDATDCKGNFKNSFFLNSMLVAMEQWMFFDVPHLLFHGHYKVISTSVTERGTGTDCMIQLRMEQLTLIRFIEKVSPEFQRLDRQRYIHLRIMARLDNALL